MESHIDSKIKENLEQITDYNPDLKGQVWENIQKEIQLDPGGSQDMKKRNKKILKNLLIATLCGTFMGGTLFAKELITYFSEQKVRKVHDIQTDTFITEAAQLYESPLGYMTYYDPSYFQVSKEKGTDYFRAKQDSHTYLSITLEKDKDFETLLFEETGKKKEDLSPFLFDEYAVEIEYASDPSAPAWQTVTMLCDAKELGTFVLRARYNTSSNASLSRMCHNMANEFIPLYAENKERITKGKPQLYFEYNQSDYELAQYSSESHRIYLQKKGVEMPDYESDILFTSMHHIDTTPAQKVDSEFKSHEENRLLLGELLQELESEEKKHPDTSLTTLKETPNDLNVTAKKLVETKDTDGSIQKITYFIEDGQGGCYEIYIYLPNHEDLEGILKSITLKAPSAPPREYRIITDETLG